MYDKVLPYLGTLCDIIGQQNVIQLYEKGELELLPISIARGRSFEKSIILVNEAQNLTDEHIKLLIARCGEGSRIFFDGDIKQADQRVFKEKNGLELLLKLANSEKYAEIANATKNQFSNRENYTLK